MAIPYAMNKDELMKACADLHEAQQKINQFHIETYMQQEFLDEDGYPTPAALTIIELWSYEDKRGWFEFIKNIWWMPSFGWHEVEEINYAGNVVQQYHLSTGGWSGNESIIQAMQDNKNFMWTFTWVQSRRGGHYIFEIDDKQQKRSIEA